MQGSSLLSSVLSINPSSHLKELLNRSLPLAVAIGTEKSRSELRFLKFENPTVIFGLTEYSMRPIEQILEF